MKRTLSLLTLSCFIIIAGLLVVGCGGSSPSEVARKIHVAIEKGDTKAYAELMTSETAGMMAMLSGKMEGTLAEQGGITSTTETIKGDTAVVTVTYKDGTTTEMDFIRVDGKWKWTIDMGGK